MDSVDAAVLHPGKFELGAHVNRDGGVCVGLVVL